MVRGLIAGMAAGAAGTAVLDAVTYIDMAVRGRPASNTPQDSIETLTASVGLRIPGAEETRRNRLSGLASLAGIATGIGIGAVTGIVAARWPARGVLSLGTATSAGAMAGTAGSMTALRVTDPRKWSVGDWLSDFVPHLAYGFVTAAVARRLLAE
jgi:hypothetical protein